MEGERAHTLILHQALHGYREGHQLLSISKDLSREHLAQMRVMSDLSGPGFRPRFDTYVTGYMLAGSEIYAVARTWFAREMPRPGCVWTHTLLINPGDISLLTSAAQLNGLFRRPVNAEQFDAYSKVLTYQIQQPTFVAPLSDAEDTVAATLAALYSARATVALVSEDSSVHEDLVWKIWLQQWPALRKNFSFCTGCLSLRGQSLDLLVVPPEVSRQIRDTDGISVIEPISSNSTDAWLVEAVNDLLGIGDGLSDFLWRFGPEFPPKRQSFRVLTEVFASRKHWADGPEAVNHTVSVLPPAGSQESTSLLEWLFSPASIASDQSLQRVVVRALVAHPNSSHVPVQIAALDQLARSIADQGESDAIELAKEAARFPSGHGLRYLSGLSGWYLESPENLQSVPLDILIELMRQEPGLAVSSKSWERSVDQQKVVSDALDESWARENMLAVVVSAGSVGAFAGLEALALRFGLVTIAAILAALDSLKLSATAALVEALSPHAGLVVAALTSETFGPRALWFCAAVVDPRQFMGSLNANAFLSLKRAEDMSTQDVTLDLRSSACIFALACSSRDRKTLPLFSRTLHVLYHGAERNSLPALVWERLEPFLPWTYPEWDRCARLVRAVLNLLLDAWALDEFFAIFQEVDLFCRALADLSYYWSGRKFRRHLKRALRRHEVTATAEQAATLGIDEEDDD